MPRLVLGPNYHWSLSGLDVLGTRADFLTAAQLRDSSALDPYAFTRDAYLQRRKFLIYDGNPPLEDFFDDFDD
jgi:phospholipid-binding lipoprotein MlaA